MSKEEYSFGRILFVDASNEYLEFGIIKSNNMGSSAVLAVSQKLYKNRVSELFFVELNDFLDNVVKMKLQEFDSMIVTTGPGSFTGIRIGYSSSEGLSVGLGIPLYGLSTLDAVSFALYDSINNLHNSIYCVCYELKRGLYVGRVYDYSKNNQLTLQDYVYFESIEQFANSHNISIENMYLSHTREFSDVNILLTNGVCRYLNMLAHNNSSNEYLKNIIKLDAYPEYFRLSEPEIALQTKNSTS